jgi:hypothetical protein
MVGNVQMDRLVCDQVAEYEIRCENKLPVERQVFAGRTVTPLGSLLHDVHAPVSLAKTRCYCIQVSLDLRARLTAKPISQASLDGRHRSHSSTYYYLAICEAYNVTPRSSRGLFDANSSVLTPKKYLSNAPFGHAYFSQPLHTFELIEDPILILI